MKVSALFFIVAVFNPDSLVSYSSKQDTSVEMPLIVHAPPVLVSPRHVRVTAIIADHIKRTYPEFERGYQLPKRMRVSSSLVRSSLCRYYF